MPSIKFIMPAKVDRAGDKGQRITTVIQPGTIMHDLAPDSVEFWTSKGVAVVFNPDIPELPMPAVEGVTEEQINLADIVTAIMDDLSRNYMRGVYEKIREMGDLYEGTPGLMDDDADVLKAAHSTVVNSGRFDREMRREFEEAMKGLANALS